MNDQDKKPLSIIWIYPGDLSSTLDKATWISTTKALRELGCNLILVSMGDQNCQEIEGVKVQCYSAPNIYFIGKLIYHLKVIAFIVSNQKKLDIVFFHPPSGLFFLPLVLLRKIFGLHRPLFVVDIRTVHMASKAETNWRIEIRRLYFRIIQWLFNRFIDGQTAITQRLADYYQIPSKKLLGIWESGVDLELFQPCVHSRDWSKIDESVHLIYIGTLDDGRNIGVFSRAVINQFSKGRLFTFSVVGDGFEKPELLRLSKEYPQIIFYYEPIPHKDIPLYLTKAHIGVLPFPDEPKFHVSSPIKLFEYMAAGLIILATQIVCHTDVLENRDFVFWAKESTIPAFENTLESIWANRSTLPRLSINAATAAENWSWQASAKKLKSALERALDE